MSIIKYSFNNYTNYVELDITDFIQRLNNMKGIHSLFYTKKYIINDLAIINHTKIKTTHINKVLASDNEATFLVLNRLFNVVIMSDEKKLLNLFDNTLTVKHNISLNKIFIEKERTTFINAMYQKNDVCLLLTKQSNLGYRKRLDYMIKYAKTVAKKVFIIVMFYSGNCDNFCNEECYNLLGCDKNVKVLVCNKILPNKKIKILIDFIYQYLYLFDYDNKIINEYYLI